MQLIAATDHVPHRVLSALERPLLPLAIVAFTIVAVMAHTDALTLPGDTWGLLAFPLLVIAFEQLRPGSLAPGELSLVLGWAALIIAAFLLAPWVNEAPRYAIGIPAVVGLAAFVARWPAVGLVALVAVTAVFGTFQAYLGFSPSPLLDLLLAALWIVLVVRVIVGRQAEFLVWPALLLVGAYVAVSAVDLLTTDDFAVAWLGFRSAIWYLMAILLVPYAGWSTDTLRRAAVGLIAVAILVSAYAIVRWVIGPSAREAEQAQFVSQSINVDPISKELRVVGSFFTAHQLAFWTAIMAPFCLGCALFLRRYGRLLAIAAVGVCLLAIFASGARGSLIGMAAGLGAVLLLYQFARAFPGIKVAIVGLALGGLVVLGAGGLALSANNPEKLDRYVGILDPGDDPTYEQRQIKWEAIWPDVTRHPFGQGLGTGGQGQREAGTDIKPTTFDLDNSYLKVAYEQGIGVAVLFILALGGTLISLILAALRTSSRQAAAIGFGAAGTLISVMISFWSGLYIESPQVLAAWLIVGMGAAHFVTRRPPALERDQAVPS